MTSDGQRVISASRDYTVRQWDIYTGKQLSRSLAAETKVSPLVISPDDRYVIAPYGRDNTSLAVWDVRSGELAQTLVGHAGVVHAADFTDAGYLLSASADQTLKLWDLQTGESVRTLTGHTGPVRMATVIGGSHRAISGAEDGLMKLWDLQTGWEIAQVGFKVPEHFASYQFAFAASSDGRYVIAAVDGDRSHSAFRIWNLHTGEEWLLENMRNLAIITPDNRYAIFETTNSALQVWDLQAGRRRHVLVGHESPRVLNAMVCSANSRYLITSSRDHTVRVWNLETGEEMYVFTGHSTPPHALAVTFDSRYVVSADPDRKVLCWELPTGLEIASTMLDDQICCIAVFRMGPLAVAGGTSGNLYCLQLPGTKS